MSTDLDFGQINGEILLIEVVPEKERDTYQVEIMNRNYIFKAISLMDILKEVYSVTSGNEQTTN